MDPDVRSAVPAKCPRCGMKLVSGVPDPREFAVDLSLAPRVPLPGKPLRLTITPRDPATGMPAKLQIIHEKLLHLFAVSSDLGWFLHDHPEPLGDGRFVLDTVLPHAGEYRLLADFYPENAAPQMIPATIVVPGKYRPEALTPDVEMQRGANLRISLRMEPVQPVAGKKTMLFFTPEPGELEPYLGAWGHLLVASSDLIDTIHSHPAWDERTENVQFNVIFPRPGLHRVWVQFQSRGVVNTVAFTIPVLAL